MSELEEIILTKQVFTRLEKFHFSDDHQHLADHHDDNMKSPKA